MRTLLLAVCLTLSAAGPACAQSEAQLRDYFEGKPVTVKIDMPGTSDGIDVFPDARRPIDMEEYSRRIKASGVAIHSGETVMITKVHVKDNLVEFQLAGGGFGTFGDDTSTSVYVPSVSKSRREKELERAVKDEHDSGRRRRLQHELDEVRAEREREDANNQAAAATAQEAKTARIADERLRGGSRFNIHYEDGVPAGLGPDGVMRTLADYVDFAAAPDAADAPVAAGPAPAGGGSGLRKGMTMAEVEDVLGRPEKSAERQEGSLKVVAATYSLDDQRVTAEFVEGVLVRYSITSK